MREEGLEVKTRKRRKYSSYQGEISPPAPNVLKRDFHADKPNEKWLTDITEFSLPAGKVYLSPILDCFDGLVVCWTVGTSPDAALVNGMLDRQYPNWGKGAFRHSFGPWMPLPLTGLDQPDGSGRTGTVYVKEGGVPLTILLVKDCLVV